MSDSDPLLNFFTEKEAEDKNVLYKTLGIEESATADEIKKAYRKAALRHHPDKQQGGDKDAASQRFQQVGFAYAVLSDSGKRKRWAMN